MWHVSAIAFPQAFGIKSKDTTSNLHSGRSKTSVSQDRVHPVGRKSLFPLAHRDTPCNFFVRAAVAVPSLNGAVLRIDCGTMPWLLPPSPLSSVETRLARAWITERACQNQQSGHALLAPFKQGQSIGDWLRRAGTKTAAPGQASAESPFCATSSQPLDLCGFFRTKTDFLKDQRRTEKAR